MKLKFRAEPKDVGIFIMFAAVLLYLVAIAVLNLQYLTVEARFWGLNPFPAFYPENIAATLVFYLLALIGLFMSVSSYFFDREKGFGYVPGAKEKSDGFSKLSSASEMKKKKGIEKIILKEDEYKAAGIPIILNEKEAYVDNGEGHSLIIGGTGSGKTECVMLPMSKILAKAGESMIFTDPKGELYKKLGGLLKERGYNVLVLNFRDPLRGNCWNPFSLPYRFYKEGKDDKAKELIEDLANNILSDPEGTKAEPFWTETAASYFSGLAMGLFEDAPEEYVNINSINQMATYGEEHIGRSTYLQEYFKLKGEESTAYISAAATINAPNETKGGIVSSFKTKIRIFSSREALSEMLSKTDFDFREVGKKKTAIFLIIHDEKKTYHSLVTIFLKQIYESLIDTASLEEKLRLPIRTNFMLDEFANMPPLKDVDAMITASRSRNMRFNFIIQNYSQLNKQYGSDMAETIKGNCENIHFLTTTELKALEEISKLCGEKKGKEKKDKPDESPRPLMTISDLQRLKKFQFLILKLRCGPFKSQFTPDYELNKNNAWGAIYEDAILPQRDANISKIFDIKKFVQEKLSNQTGTDFNSSQAGGINSMGRPPMPPFMMNNQMGMNTNPTPNPNNIDMNAFMKNIDDTIARLEAEEKAEKEKLKKQQEAKKEQEKETKTLEEKIEIKEPEEKEMKEVKVEAPKSRIAKDIFNEEKEFLSSEEPRVTNPKIVFNPKEEKKIKSTENMDENGIEESKAINKQEVPKIDTPSIESETPVPERKHNEKEIKKLIDEISKGKNNTQEKTDKKELEPTTDNTDSKTQTKKEIVEEPKETIKPSKIEKPKINVDVDSIIMEDNITDDQFFDDFFDDDEDDEK